MGKTRMFEMWTFTRPLPEPFASEAVRRGKKTSTEEECLSVHNQMVRAKCSTLHATTLRAILALCDLVNGDIEGAVGVQEDEVEIKWYCLEYENSTGPAPEYRVLVYEPVKGSIKGCTMTGSAYSVLPQIGERKSTGKEILILLAYASTRSGSLFDGEFAAAFQKFNEEKKKGFPDMELATNLALLCCDNMYRRLENRDALGDAGIEFDNNSIASGNIPYLTKRRLESGLYAPTLTDNGTFKILKVKSTVLTGTVGSLKGKYNLHLSLNESEQKKVPQLPDFYQVSEEILDVAEAVTQTPMRVFMNVGESGTGKTTNAKLVAQLLGLPYYAFTCGEGTDEVDLVSTMIPNTGRKEGLPYLELPTFKEMMMDPASALERVTASYDEESDTEAAFQRLLHALYQTGYESGRNEKDFIMSESCIVTGCRRPSLVEIQEPSVIAKPGTMVKLNGLLDDGAAITLSDGEVVQRHPDTIIFITSNMNYKGCRGFNESVMSRMRMVFYSEALKPEDMVKRVKDKVKIQDQALLKKMADAVCEIQKYCKDDMILGGVCGYREYEDWVWGYQLWGDVLKAAKRTVVAKAAPEEEEREAVYKKIVTKFKTTATAKKAA